MLELLKVIALLCQVSPAGNSASSIEMSGNLKVQTDSYSPQVVLEYQRECQVRLMTCVEKGRKAHGKDEQILWGCVKHDVPH